MKKIILVLLAMVILVSGCVGAKGWTKKDGTPIEPVQFEKDREECNRGWGICMAADLLLTVGILSTIHYFEAKHCMTVKGYVKAKQEEEIQKKPVILTPTTPSSSTTKILTWDFSDVKSGPGNDFSSIATVRKGDKLTIMEQSGEWVKVRLENGQEGWIRSEVLK
jgi:hypothetical protein